MNNKIKAVIFDIDGVLLDSFEANLKLFQDLMIKFGYTPPTRENYPKIFHFTMRKAIEKLTGLSNEDEIDKIWNSARNGEVSYHNDLLETPDNAEEVLQELVKDYSLAIVTSRIKESIYGIPQLAKLKKYFKVAVSCYDTVKHKPHPEPLLFAADKLNIQPEECVYIGDVENDVIAAKAAGMKSIIYSQDKIKEADYCINIFKDIPEVVKKLNN